MQPDHPTQSTVDERAAAALARVEARIRIAVESAPPLPADLQTRLVELIRAAPHEGATAA